MADRKCTVKAGRQIYFGGLPFISINKEGHTSPRDADEITHLIARLLNEEGLSVNVKEIKGTMPRAFGQGPLLLDDADRRSVRKTIRPQGQAQHPVSRQDPLLVGASPIVPARTSPRHMMD